MVLQSLLDIKSSFSKEKATELSKQAQRAYALVLAMQRFCEPLHLNHLLSLIGHTAKDISPDVCQQLAKKLKRLGHPLSDEGIRQFRLERGLSPNIQFDEAICLAYSRLAQGCETILNISRSDWLHLNLEERRALQVLLLIGQHPETLLAVRQKLGINNTSAIEQGKILVGRITLERLMAWLKEYHCHLHDKGLQQLVAFGAIRQPVVDAELAACLTQLILDPTEPEHDYKHITFDNVVVNHRTLQMLDQAKIILKHEFPLNIIKGSYWLKNSRGAHPHLGGGVIDLAVCQRSLAAIDYIVGVLRRVGFAAWYRKRATSSHIHAIAIGDRELSKAAEWQVKAYFKGKDGRSLGQPDPHGGLPPHLPHWLIKYRLTAK